MITLRTRLAIRRRRAALLAVIPLVVAALAAVGTSAVPRSLVHGDANTGPKALGRLAPVALDYHPSVRWGPGRTSVLLVAQPRAGCRVRLISASSTAPGRVEADVVETGRPCGGTTHRVTTLALPLPTLPDPFGGTWVQVGVDALYLANHPATPHRSKGDDLHRSPRLPAVGVRS